MIAAVLDGEALGINFKSGLELVGPELGSEVIKAFDKEGCSLLFENGLENEVGVFEEDVETVGKEGKTE